MMPTITRKQWSEQHVRCMRPGCEWKSHNGSDWVLRFRPDGSKEPCRLVTHEIVRGSGRAAAMEEPSTWLRLCEWCHVDEPWNRVGTDNMAGIREQLVWKKWFDGEHYDRARVLWLKHWGPDAVTEDEVDEELRRRMK